MQFGNVTLTPKLKTENNEQIFCIVCFLQSVPGLEFMDQIVKKNVHVMVPMATLNLVVMQVMVDVHVPLVGEEQDAIQVHV